MASKKLHIELKMELSYIILYIHVLVFLTVFFYTTESIRFIIMFFHFDPIFLLKMSVNKSNAVSYLALKSAM